MKYTVLVINDDPKIHWLLQEGIGEEFNLQCAMDGVEGLNAIRVKPPDLILLNVRMPRADGFWVLNQLKKLSIDTPVVVQSFYPAEYVLEETTGFKVHGHVIGEFSVARIREAILKVLQ